MKNNNTSVITLIDNDDEILYTKGLADQEYNIEAKVDDLFETGSTSKMFTAIAILHLQDK